MIVDDLVVVGARPLFLTDYIACGHVVPERIAALVAGIADACRETGTALLGGETAEHPDLLGHDEYDLAGAAVGVVEADALLGPERVRPGDVVLGMASSGLHSNGFSLVRRVLADAGVAVTDEVDGVAGPIGETLLTPTRLYTAPLLQVLDGANGAAVHALGHVTGGGIAANLARVLPQGTVAEVDRGAWTPDPVFGVLARLGGFGLPDAEGTWNLGLGMLAVVDAAAADAVAAELTGAGIATTAVATVTAGTPEGDGYERGAKGVDGGAVRLVGAWR
jgi:phosphoribosylformylglycinamidine cyclo-ligase